MALRFSPCLAAVIYLAAAGCLAFLVESRSVAAKPPNVILIITDDQGYGDLACHGNPILKTPHIDRLYRDSIRLTDFHVDTVCSPTRAALLTGKYAKVAGVQGLVRGYSLLRGSELTMAEVFRDAGYSTAHFGKWHLGDNYPCRPEDQGFEETLSHRAGGVMQGSDYWGNDYFDDHYLHNGVYKQYKGYCTDVWFGEAMQWMKRNREKPFFVYLATNAPHGPYIVSESYSRPYKEHGRLSNFYGMIANLDDNMGQLSTFLQEESLEEDTLLIWMTDNGSVATRLDRKAFNGGQKGDKYSLYDGGHRVPCFIRWPAQGHQGGWDVKTPTAHIDLLPTLMAMTGIPSRDDVHFDGIDISALLKKDATPPSDRSIIVNNTFKNYPTYHQGHVVVRNKWRLISEPKGSRLYDIQKDPMQGRDVSAKHPEVVRELTKDLHAWQTRVAPLEDRYEEIVIGSEADNPTTVFAFDWHAQGGQPANQVHLRAKLRKNGWWAVKIEQDGKYRIRLRSVPDEAKEAVPKELTRLQIGAIDSESFTRFLKATDSVPSPTKIDMTGSTSEDFVVELKAGSTQLKTELGEGGTGAYFVYVDRLDED